METIKHTSASARVTADWIREQIKANKIPVTAKQYLDYWSISKEYASHMEGTFSITQSTHEIVVDLNSRISHQKE